VGIAAALTGSANSRLIKVSMLKLMYVFGLLGMFLSFVPICLL
jgi:hypothetical protein